MQIREADMFKVNECLPRGSFVLKVEYYFVKLPFGFKTAGRDQKRIRVTYESGGRIQTSSFVSRYNTYNDFRGK